jgi:methyltransferase (TIGR00027 family)
VKANQASATAEAGLAMRALESARSSRSRLFSDQNAKKFLKTHHQALIALCAIPPVQRAVEWMCDWVYPGAPADFICRTRFIDDAIERGIADGARRIVIVGAGYDSRSFRLAARTDLQVIEIDHPDTQAVKMARATQVIDPTLLDRVRFIPHDLSQGAPPALPPSTAPSIFVLEGLTGYLTPAAIDSLFAWMRSMSVPGSSVVFTYPDRKFLDGHCTGKAAQTLSRYLQRVGEPFRMGWYPEELNQYCAERGFALVENHGYLELGKRYLAPLNRRLHVYEFGHIAIARRHS